MRQITLSEAGRMLAEVFDESQESLTRDRHRDTIPGWDSMGALLLMAELDERLGIELTPEQSRNMQKIGDVLDYLESRGSLAP